MRREDENVKGWGKPVRNYSGAMIADAIIDELNGRGGFDGWWGNIDEDTQDEIRDAIATIAQRRRHIEDLKEPTFRRCREVIGEKRWAELRAEVTCEATQDDK